MSRATDEIGAVQPSRAAWLAKNGARGGYHCNMVQSWGVDPLMRGRVDRRAKTGPAVACRA